MTRLLVALALAYLPLGASAQHGMERLGPRTFLSPSGSAKLWVNPSNPYGAGPAYCRLTVRGKKVWERDLPFTLVMAGVAEDGRVGGYAYTGGREWEGAFVVAILDRKGRVLMDQRTKRTPSHYEHVDPDPKASGIIFDPSNDRMVVRTAIGFTAESWRVYKISSGKQTAVLHPNPAGRSQSVQSASAVAGTPLILVNWYRYDDYKDQMSQSFTLVDEWAKPVWKLDLPGDYEIGSPDIRIETRNRILEKGTILHTDSPRRFEVRFIQRGQRVTFGVARAGKGWKVSELSRAPYRDLAVASKPAVFKAKRVSFRPVRSLRIPLETGATSVVRNVGSFDFLDDGRIAFLRAAERDLCVVDANGKLSRRIPLPGGAGEKIFLAKASGAHFVLVSGSLAWHVDLNTGRFQLAPSFGTYDVESIAAFPDGRFAVLSTEMSKYTMTSHLTVHAPDGRKLWTTNDAYGYGGKGEDLLSPEDVDVDSKGRLVVLDNVRHSLQLFSQDGRFEKIIDLDKVWGREASYPTEVTCLPDGGYWLYDGGSERPCYRLSSTGKILRNFKPALATGQAFGSKEAIRVDRQGSAWTTNGKLLLRLNETGHAVRTLGATSAANRLTGVGAVHVSPNGRVEVRDARTDAVHTFSRGVRLFVTKVKPTDFSDQSDPRMVVARSGDVYLMFTASGNYLRYAADGRRVGEVRWHRDDSAPRPPFRPDPRQFWWGAELIDAKGKPVAKLDRWPDHGWMDGPDAMAPDGRLMAFESDGGRRIAFFRADGTPESQSVLPPGMGEIPGSAYDGRRVWLVTEKGLVSVDKAGKARWVFTPAGWSGLWKVFPSAGGFALYDGDRTVTWYGD